MGPSYRTSVSAIRAGYDERLFDGGEVKRIASSLVNLGLSLVFAAMCAAEARAQSAAPAVAFGVFSGILLAIALGYVAMFVSERRAAKPGRVASGAYGSDP